MAECDLFYKKKSDSDIMCRVMMQMFYIRFTSYKYADVYLRHVFQADHLIRLNIYLLNIC